MYVAGWQGLNPGWFVRRGRPNALPFPLAASQSMHFYRARYAIYHLLRALRFRQGESVLVPDYHHGSEVSAIRASGASVRYYPIGRDLEPDLDELRRLSRLNARALYVIHFLGWPQPIAELMALCRERGMILIEDCALALLSGAGRRPLGTYGDYAVFCLYKTLPVPNGGVLVQNGQALEDLSGLELKPRALPSGAGMIVDLMLEWIRSRSDRLGKALSAPKTLVDQALRWKRSRGGESGFDLGDVNSGPSPWSSALLKRFDYDEIRQRRRDNFAVLRQKLAGKATLLRQDLGEGVCPLVFPVLVPDKRAAARALRARGISALEWWNDGPPEANTNGSSHVRFLRDHVLGLPIHQDVTLGQVEYMADQMLSLKLHF